MAQKLDAGAEYLSIDGAIRVISDDFSISLLNPDSELYRYKADKYASMVSKRIFLSKNVKSMTFTDISKHFSGRILAP